MSVGWLREGFGFRKLFVEEGGGEELVGVPIVLPDGDAVVLDADEGEGGGIVFVGAAWPIGVAGGFEEVDVVPGEFAGAVPVAVEEEEDVLVADDVVEFVRALLVEVGVVVACFGGGVDVDGQDDGGVGVEGVEVVLEPGELGGVRSVC